MIYLVRHGLDDERFIGGYSDVCLLDEGIKQIEFASEWILKQGFDIRKIYSSDVLRAIQSASIIAKYLNLEILIDKGLREQDKGLLNGMDREMAEVIYPEYVFSKNINMRYPNGESLMDLYLRVKKLLLNISSFDNSLIVTHRGVINMIYYLTCGDELDMNKGKYDVTHASIHEFDIGKSKIRRIR